MAGTKKDIDATKQEFEKALKKKEEEKYILRLYVAGLSAKSTRAIANVNKLCEEYLKGRYELEVVDIYQQSKLALGEQIIATPTLIKQLPLPLRRMIGDLSDKDKFLVGIDLRPRKTRET